MNAPNVLLIVVDSLRKDYATPLEETLKKIGFISYENVISPAPWTIPSYASMFTGLYPIFHKAHETRDKKDFQIRLGIDNILSKELSNIGYNTYLFSGNPYIRPEFGFAGFNHFYEVPFAPILTLLSVKDREKLRDLMEKQALNTKLEVIKCLIFNGHYNLLFKSFLSYLVNKPYLYTYAFLKNWPTDKGARNILNILKKLLKTDQENPRFFLISLMEVHEPYSIEDIWIKQQFEQNLKRYEIDEDLVRRWRRKYPSAVKYVTERVIDIMKVMRNAGVFDNSLIIVTSDHGQLLGEHGRIGHGVFLYDELLRVPLLIKYPTNLEISIKQDGLENEKFISLVKLKSLILGVVQQTLEDDSVLFSNMVLAESYGIPYRVTGISNEDERKNIEKLEKYRIAVYHKKLKGIFNVNDWKFEEVTSYDPNKEVSDDEVKKLRKMVVKFLNIATATRIRGKQLDC